MERSENLKNEKFLNVKWGKLIPIFGGALFLPFICCIYGALEIYLNNRKEFWFDLNTAILASSIIFMIFWMINSFLLILLKKINYKIYAVLFIVEFVCFAVIYIQSNFFVQNLPALDGSIPDWSVYRWDNVISVIICLIVAGTAFIITKKLGMKKSINISFGIMCFFSLVLLSTLIVLGLSAPKTSAKTSLIFTDKDLFEMSEKQNLVVLLLDAADSVTFTEEMKNNPEWNKQFSDFTFYPDTLGCYSFTSRCIPFILSGIWYENERDYDEYCSVAYKKSQLLNRLQRDGFEIGVYDGDIRGGEELLSFENVFDYSEVTSYSGLGITMLRLSLFKSLPYGLKRFCFFNMDKFNEYKKSINNYKVFNESNEYFWNKISSEKIVKTEKKCFRYIHIRGAHVPFQYDKNMEKIEQGTYEQAIQASMTITNKYIEMLKNSGVYDNTAIIVMADHGYVTEYRQSPLFMVKGIGEKHDNIQISELPLSYDDLQNIYVNLIDGLNSSEVMKDIPDYTTVGRRFLYYQYLSELCMEEKRLYGNVWDNDSMVSTGNMYVLGETGEPISIEYLDKLAVIDSTPEIHVDIVCESWMLDGQMYIAGWLYDERLDTVPREMYIETNGALYKAAYTSMHNTTTVNGKYYDNGFVVFIPADADEQVKMHVIDTEGNLMKTLLFDRKKIEFVE